MNSLNTSLWREKNLPLKRTILLGQPTAPDKTLSTTQTSVLIKEPPDGSSLIAKSMIVSIAGLDGAVADEATLEAFVSTCTCCNC
jgi:hypothetical protein